MNVKKLLIAWLAGFIIMSLLSGLWYMVLMSDYNHVQFADVERAEFLFIWIVIGYLALSLLMAYLYPIGYKGKSPTKEGLRFGLLMGLVIAIPYSLILYATYTIPLTATLIDIVYQVVEITIVGIVIGYVYGSGAKAGSD